MSQSIIRHTQIPAIVIYGRCHVGQDCRVFCWVLLKKNRHLFLVMHFDFHLHLLFEILLIIIIKSKGNQEIEIKIMWEQIQKNRRRMIRIFFVATNIQLQLIINVMIVNNRKKLLDLPVSNLCIPSQRYKYKAISQTKYKSNNQRLDEKQLRERDSKSCSLYQQWKQSRNNSAILPTRSIKQYNTKARYKYETTQQDLAKDVEIELNPTRLITEQIKIRPFDYVDDGNAYKRIVSPQQFERHLNIPEHHLLQKQQSLRKVLKSPKMGNQYGQGKKISEKSVSSSNRSIFDKLEVKLKQITKPGDTNRRLTVQKTIEQAKGYFEKPSQKVNKHVRWKSQGNGNQFQTSTLPGFSITQTVQKIQKQLSQKTITKTESSIQNYQQIRKVSESARIVVSQIQKQKFWHKFRQHFCKNQKDFGEVTKLKQNWKQKYEQKQVSFGKKAQITRHQINRLINSNQCQIKLKAQLINKIHSQVDRNIYK